MARKKNASLTRLHRSLRDFALTFPGSHEDFPWGHTAIKVNKKIFLSLFLQDDKLNLSMKLPLSGKIALELPFTEPTRYGLGKGGWITSKLTADIDVPIELFQEWVDESYRAIAPKKLVAQLETESDD